MSGADPTVTVSNTLTSGIQDISALLPLLGTEQCEGHVGSALAEGFLYAAASPLSIFGSLGIVKAGVKTLVASFSSPFAEIPRGAQSLRDAGFVPSGKSLALIMMDPQSPYRYLAESKLDGLYDKYHLESATNLRLKAPWRERESLISLAKFLVASVVVVAFCIPLLVLHFILPPLAYSAISNPTKRGVKPLLLTLHQSFNAYKKQYADLIRNVDWNTRLLVATAFLSTLSLSPYVFFTLTPNKLPRSIVLLFPITRAVGAFLASVSIPILIQKRLFRILECRLVLHQLDADIRSLFPNLGTEKPHENDSNNISPCHQDQPTEVQLHRIQRCIRANLGNSKRTNSSSHLWDYICSAFGSLIRPRGSAPDFELGSLPNKSEWEALQEKMDDATRASSSQLLWPYYILLVVGIAASLVGYVGCFSVVQNCRSSKGPPLWLGLEAALSLLRFVLWGFNPAFDDPDPIKLLFDKSTSPLVPGVCRPTMDFPDDRVTLDIVPAPQFLRHITTYTGFIKKRKFPDLDIFYTLTRNLMRWPCPAQRIFIISFRLRNSPKQGWAFFDNEKGQTVVHRATVSSTKVEIERAASTNDLVPLDQRGIQMLYLHRKELLDRINAFESQSKHQYSGESGSLVKMATCVAEYSWKVDATSDSDQLNSVENPQLVGTAEDAPSRLEIIPVQAVRQSLKNDISMNSLQEDTLLKIFCGIFLFENIRFEQLLLSGFRDWLRKTSLQVKPESERNEPFSLSLLGERQENLTAFEHVNHRAGLFWPRINARSRQLDECLSPIRPSFVTSRVPDDPAQAVSTLTLLQRDASAHMREKWAGLCGDTWRLLPGTPVRFHEQDPGTGVEIADRAREALEHIQETLLNHLRSQENQDQIWLDSFMQRCMDLRRQSDIRILKASLQIDLILAQDTYKPCLPNAAHHHQTQTIDVWGSPPFHIHIDERNESNSSNKTGEVLAGGVRKGLEIRTEDLNPCHHWRNSKSTDEIEVKQRLLLKYLPERAE